MANTYNWRINALDAKNSRKRLRQCNLYGTLVLL